MAKLMDKTKDIFQYALGGLITIGFFALLCGLLVRGVPDTNKDLLNLSVGALISSFSMIVGYFYGSSKGSAEKTEVMNKQLIENGNNK